MSKQDAFTKFGSMATAYAVTDPKYFIDGQFGMYDHEVYQEANDSNGP